ncbi:MAG: hypothetical protein ACPGN3_17185 [Opitutales bacterium]
MFERESVERHQLKSEATLAAESLASFAAAEILRDFEDNPHTSFENYSLTDFTPASLGSGFVSKHVDPSSLEVQVTSDPDWGGMFVREEVDDLNPANLEDPKIGETPRSLNLLIGASAQASNGKISQTAYVEQTLQLRTMTLFNFTIFGSEELEFLPDDQMTVEGRVHANGNIYVNAPKFDSGDTGLEFLGKVTTGAELLHGVLALDGESFQFGEISFAIDSDGTQRSIFNANDGSTGLSDEDWERTEDAWSDSSASTWDEDRKDWNGFLEDFAPIESFDALPTYDATTNNSHAIIEPVPEKFLLDDYSDRAYAANAGLILRLEPSDQTVTDPDTGEVTTVQVGARQGPDDLYDDDSKRIASYTENGYVVKAYRYDYNDVSGEFQRVEVKLPSGLVGSANQADPEGTVDPTAAMSYIESDAQVESFKMSIHSDTRIAEGLVWETEQIERWEELKYTPPEFPDNSDIAFDQDERDSMIAAYEVEYEADLESATAEGNYEAYVDFMNSRGNTPISEVEFEETPWVLTGTRRVSVLDSDGNRIPAIDSETGEQATFDRRINRSRAYVEGGFHDYRQNRSMDTVYVDIGKLKELVEDTSTQNEWKRHYDVSAGTSYAEFDPDQHWNGVVYLELPTEDDSEGRGRSVLSDPNVAVMLINGDELPNQSVAYIDGDGVSRTRDLGFSFATNGPLYVLGNYNSDGDVTTGSSSTADSNEIPAGLAAETLTVLSEEFAETVRVPSEAVTWDEDNSQWEFFWTTGRRQLAKDAEHDSDSAHATTPVEIVAGVLTGWTPTEGVEQQSGGVHNSIRLLQNWQPDGDATMLNFRGSMVLFFRNEVHDQHIPSDYLYIFNAPAREFEMSNHFKNGLYPPPALISKSYRRISTKEIDAQTALDRFAIAIP